MSTIYLNNMLAKINTQFKWTLLGLSIGLVFLLISLRDIDVQAVYDSLLTIKFFPATMVIVAGLLFMLIKALRWSVILDPVTHVDFSILHSAVYIGTAANLIIVHSGEVARSAIIGKQARIAASAVLASIGVERIFDFMVVIVLFGVLLITSEKLPDYVTAAGFVAIFMVVAGLITIVSLMVPSKTRRSVRMMVIRYLPEKLSVMIRSQIKRSLIGFSTLGSPSLVIKVFFLSILQWSCIVFAIWLCAYSVGYTATISMSISVWILMVIGLTLPSSPAQLGTTQLAFTLGLSIALNEMQIPFAASLVYTCCVNIPYMIIGAFYWLRVGSLRKEPQKNDSIN
ncbi:MAG TPA: lysylphosphatidylglycerol synthase transmembrane domain-containing protein [Nitrosomonas sp.]|mgnify:CR=1 FL=1|nr:lysylphosphatidylglycerol synthase transmembrane domain-containing protein [Nitrosomonas sp.]HQX13067.1 lysylphosphatidylglycerol synthase transmembrane domain-containing protein [Nitrosomonas sp.]HRB45142.1 lysylphosphatidylglycerol synthase transmembrane domain-containing protein [Nitrosomonas sp.]